MLWEPGQRFASILGFTLLTLKCACFGLDHGLTCITVTPMQAYLNQRSNLIPILKTGSGKSKVATVLLRFR